MGEITYSCGRMADFFTVPILFNVHQFCFYAFIGAVVLSHTLSTGVTPFCRYLDRFYGLWFGDRQSLFVVMLLGLGVFDYVE